MKIKIYNEFSKELIGIWQDLENNGSSSVFQRLSWVLNWYDTIGWPIHQCNLCIVSITSKNKVVAILPMGIKKIGFIKKLEWLGGIHSDYMGPILSASSEDVLGDIEVIWPKIVKYLPTYDILYLDKQIPQVNRCANPFFGMKNSTQITSSHQAKLDNNWEDYTNTVSKKVLNDNVRQRRRLSSLGSLTYSTLKGNAEDENLFFEKLFLFKSARYKEMGVEDVLKQDEHRKFYQKMPSQISQSSRVHCSILKLDEEIIALHWGVVDMNIFYYLMPAYSSKNWSKYSPGKILLEDLMVSCKENGINVFDFTSGDEPYKKIWSNDSFPIALTIRSNSIKGNAYIIFLNFKGWLSQFALLKKIFKKIFNKT